MNELMIVFLNLYDDADYEYTVTLQRVAYKLRFYYNERMKTWIMDVRYANNDPIVLGLALVPEYPIIFDYVTDLEGYFSLVPIGDNRNETITNPYEIFKYYQLMYLYMEDDDEEV